MAMSLVGKSVPDFELPGVRDGEPFVCRLRELRGRWVMLVFFPAAFTGLCGSEVEAFATRVEELRGLDCEAFGIGVDSHHALRAWVAAGQELGGLGGRCSLPLLSDLTKNVARDFGVLDEADGVALRALFIIDPAGTVVHEGVNARNVGRSTVEALRLLKAFQHVANNPEARCRPDWQPVEPSPR